MEPADDPFDDPSDGQAARGRRSDAEQTTAPVGSLVELNALLGRGTRYVGKLWFDGRVRIEGSFEGEIHGEDVLVVGQGAEVVASIQVGSCIVTGGTVRGDIRARDAIELHAPAVVTGNLHAPNIFIDRGVQFEGSCKMAPLEGSEATGTDEPDAGPGDDDRGEHDDGREPDGHHEDGLPDRQDDSDHEDGHDHEGGEHDQSAS